jgi:hypothetical protein
LHRFRKERKRSPRGCFECNDTTHFIADCPKRKNSAMRGTMITISLSMTSLTDSVVLKDTFQEVSRPIPKT